MIKQQRKIKFINDCDAIVDTSELEKAILWFQKSFTASKKHIYKHGEYSCISIQKQKIHVHRLLMIYWLNIKIPKEYHVHHENGNKLDNRKENLSLILNSTHLRQHNKGKKVSEKTKRLIGEANKRRKGSKFGITKKGVSYQKIWELYEKGFSINKISKILKYEWSRVKIRINEIIENPELLEENK